MRQHCIRLFCTSSLRVFSLPIGSFWLLLKLYHFVIIGWVSHLKGSTVIEAGWQVHLLVIKMKAIYLAAGAALSILTSGTLLETSGSPALGAGSNCRLCRRTPSKSKHSFQTSSYLLHSQCILEVLVNFHYGRLVSTSVTVIWRTENGDDVSFL
jgi:hypothetical protein